MLAGKVEHIWGVLLIWVGLVASSAALYAFYGPKVIAPVLNPRTRLFRSQTRGGNPRQLTARTPISIRWKTSGTIFLSPNPPKDGLGDSP